MGFQQGLSGLSASSKSLDVIGHNIANANTVGMKTGRAEFSELVASSLGLSTGTGAGLGVAVANVSTQFTQGSISITGADTDVAINGGGFFQVTQPDGSTAFTRAGNFKIDKDGYLLTNSKAKVAGYQLDPNTGIKTSTTAGPLQLPTSKPVPASATTVISAEFNLDARILNNTALTAAGKAINPRSTFGTSLNAFDSQGVPTPVTLYFEKTATANEWKVYGGLDVAASVAPPVTAVTFTSLGTIQFDPSGKITSAVSAVPAVPPPTGFSLNLAAGTIASSNPNQPPPGKLPTAITLKLDNVTQFGNRFSVSNLTQDGYTSGEVTGVGIGDDGRITARYSNGQTQYVGQMALANFRNVQGLAPLGGSLYAETSDSGQPVPGAPGEGNFGTLRSGALEDSNVDLTAELVNMMTAQRAYQANAQTIKTQDQVMQTLVNLR